MKLEASQMQELADRYSAGSLAQHASRFLRMNSLWKAHKVLRPHWIEPIDDEYEVEVRDNLDHLLAVCSIFEIVAFLSQGSTIFPERLLEDLRSILSHEAVRRYYEETYPLALPAAFRKRLQHCLPEAYLKADPRAPNDEDGIFLSLIDLDRRRLENEQLRMFLDLLDDYWFEDELDLDGVIDALRKPKRLASVLKRDSKLLPDEPRELIAVAIEGFDQYLRFAQDLRALLGRAEAYPLGGLIWHFYSYFFGASADNVRTTIGKVQEAINDWAIDGETGALSVVRAKEMVRLFDELTDGVRWNAPLRRIGVTM